MHTNIKGNSTSLDFKTKLNEPILEKYSRLQKSQNQKYLKKINLSGCLWMHDYFLQYFTELDNNKIDILILLKYVQNQKNT